MKQFYIYIKPYFFGLSTIMLLGLTLWSLDKGCYHHYINICFICNYADIFNNIAHILLGMLSLLIFYLPITFFTRNITNKYIRTILLLLIIFLSFYAIMIFEQVTAPSNSGAADKIIFDTLWDGLGVLIMCSFMRR